MPLAAHEYEPSNLPPGPRQLSRNVNVFPPARLAGLQGVPSDGGGRQQVWPAARGLHGVLASQEGGAPPPLPYPLHSLRPSHSGPSCAPCSRRRSRGSTRWLTSASASSRRASRCRRWSISRCAHLLVDGRCNNRPCKGGVALFIICSTRAPSPGPSPTTPPVRPPRGRLSRSPRGRSSCRGPTRRGVAGARVRARDGRRPRLLADGARRHPEVNPDGRARVFMRSDARANAIL